MLNQKYKVSLTSYHKFQNWQFLLLKYINNYPLAVESYRKLIYNIYIRAKGVNMDKLPLVKECELSNVPSGKISMEQHENILDFLKMLFSEDVVDYNGHNQETEMTFL